MIPLVDLSAHQSAIADAVALGSQQVLAHSSFVNSPQVRVFEQEFAVLKELHAAEIGAGIHYPVPPHLTPACAGLGYAEGSFPVSERAVAETLSLPLFAEITAEQQERFVSVLCAALR